MANVSPPSSHKQGGARSSVSVTLTEALQTPPGVYNVQQLVANSGPLLDVVISRLGQDPPGQPSASSILIDGLAASLSTRGRESTFPLEKASNDVARSEIVHQANRVASTIVKHVKKSVKPAPKSLDFRIRSPCEGHLWTHSVAALLFGPRSDSQLMELYNEWLHRMVLLRDSLIPFENFEEVPLVIPPGSTRGIRDLEEPRRAFLVHCLTGNIQQMAIVDLAKVFTARGLPRGGYGFQYSQGLILPAFLSGSRSLHLLRYHPAHLNSSETDLLFDYEHAQYIAAPRTEIKAEDALTTKTNWNAASLLDADTTVTESSLVVEQPSGDALRRAVKLGLTLDSGACVSVDLGQIARGRRYAYEIRSDKKTSDDEASDSTAYVHSAASILSKPGLVISPRVTAGSPPAVHVIPTADPILRLALLGKLYPENVILVKEQDSLAALSRAGKNFAEKIVIFEKNGAASASA
ncbi:hypothetical protein BBK36DRAFT_47169 [Trichoderma citrinoviride]|uniref:Uncharacterized protein n=1 Tax=Trichoderma citrinoviride TaxID=58853 RepID=A0A2T4BL37_9HYPO|nr:hypothetical protein BBK36DRAFT_47169 [Trichoderma citrinoviride]PTB69979.1 hypothetical protein BBK36DRAFT_47169 [Trichoderma citrinoviride]